MYIISFLCLSAAALCNAIMDKPSHHFYHSIFKTFKPRKWWDAKNGWRNKYVDGDSRKGRVKWNILGIKINKPVQVCDFWHFFKMLMVFFIVGAIMTFPSESVDWEWWKWYLAFAGYGVAWNGTFTLFYTYIFDLRKF